MKLTNLEIWIANPNLQTLSQQKLPIRTSFALVKLSQALKSHLEAIEETRKILVNKFGTPDEKTGQPAIAPNTPAMEAFSAEGLELLKGEVEVDFKDKIRLPEKVAATCDKCPHNMDRMLEIEPAILLALDKFVELPS